MISNNSGIVDLDIKIEKMNLAAGPFLRGTTQHRTSHLKAASTPPKIARCSNCTAGLLQTKYSYHSNARSYSCATQTKSPSLCVNPEVFVDASNLGIGLIFGSRWLAWKFNQANPYIPRNSGRIDTSWSELIAAELGVRTLIAAGFRSTTVRMRSDNTSVVSALKNRTWGNIDRLTCVLARIMELCDAYELDLRPKHVEGEKNPADAPSRGRFPPLEKLLVLAPSIPLQLEGVVTLCERSYSSISV